MNRLIAYIILFVCFSQQLYSQQEDGVVALDLPIRNSLKFNRYAINPTFSFVREQNKYLSLTNKRQWVQFDNAPQTYLFSYSGRFRENIGAGIGLFQQDYGVLTTFGGILNFAYNVVFDRESNLTFGTNLGFYSSGINDGRVVTNFQDPSLANIESNAIIALNPGINYGTSFFDFGVSVNNLVAYNLRTSEMLKDNPEQGFQAHVMYTGYMNTSGFFDQSRFSTLIRSEFKKDQTIVSGIAMLAVPKGIWVQAGYNSMFGMSAGIGLNITQEIALEYNYEQAMGDISSFGNSHEITLAYKFKNTERYNYGDDDDEQALLTPSRRSKRVLASSVPESKKNLVRKKRVAPVKEEPVEAATVEEEPKEIEKSEDELIEEQRLKAIEIEAKKREDARLKAEAEEKAKQEAIEKQKAEEAARIKAEQARLAEQARIKAEAEAKAKREEAARQKAEQERIAREEAAKVKAEQERLAQEARIKAEEEEKARLAEIARVKAENEERARLAEEARIKAEQEEQARLLAEAKKKEEEERRRLEIEAEEIISMIDLDGVMVPVPRDNKTREMNGLTALTSNSKIEQENLISQLREKIAIKQQDLNDLKQENDLSEQGIVSAPKAFKSISAENAALAKVQNDLENIIKTRSKNIADLEALYNERLKSVSDRNEGTNQYYANKIKELKLEQNQANQVIAQLETNLERINVATEVERKRRIKLAAYDNEQARYQKDRNALELIKETTPMFEDPLTAEDFDSGEVLSNIQIVKGITNTDNGYYVVVAVHTDIAKRDEFLKKAVASGEDDIDFFFDVNTNKYYIYYQKFEQLNTANNALMSKGDKPYNQNMSLVKVEN